MQRMESRVAVTTTLVHTPSSPPARPPSSANNAAHDAPLCTSISLLSPPPIPPPPPPTPQREIAGGLRARDQRVYCRLDTNGIKHARTRANDVGRGGGGIDIYYIYIYKKIITAVLGEINKQFQDAASLQQVSVEQHKVGPSEQPHRHLTVPIPCSSSSHNAHSELKIDRNRYVHTHNGMHCPTL